MVARSADVRFTRPYQRILVMLLFLGAVAAVGWALRVELATVFFANRELNGLIAFVFGVGVLVAFWQVFGLFSAVRWIGELASQSQHIKLISPPGLLVSMDPLRKSGGRQAIGAGTSRSILDSVATRIDENRDVLRYIGGLLIFLGLLGTFWGLANTVPAVVETIRNIQPQPGEEGSAVFGRIIDGLEKQLGGMGVAFSSSLLGLAGSLVIGFLELMAAGSQNRFYGELETWLSQMTKLAAVGEFDGDGAVSGELADQMDLNSRQLEALNRVMAKGEERRSADSAQIAAAVQNIERLAAQAIADRELMEKAMAAQAKLADSIEKAMASGGLGGEIGGSGGGYDAETRRHIRNIDVLLARLVEEAAAGRQETADALRREMRAVGRAVGKVSAAMGGDPAA